MKIKKGSFVRAKWSDPFLGFTQDGLYVVVFSNQIISVVDDHGNERLFNPDNLWRRFRPAPCPV